MEGKNISKVDHSSFGIPKRILFNRSELAGAMGDLGIFIPLVVGMTAITGVNPVNVLFTFGIFYISSGLFFGFPLPVQPMKAIAVIAIAEQFDSTIIIGAGLFVGVFFIFLAITGLLDYLERVTPKSVVRGIQLGLGLKMTTIAVTYMFSDHQLAGILEQIEIFSYIPLNWILTLIGIAIVLVLFRNRRFPAALILLLFGVVTSLLNGFPISLLSEGISINLPSIGFPEFENVVIGALVLGIPQIPLTIGNSIFATKSVFQILFPDRPSVSTKKIAFSLGVMNIVSSFLGGIPVCHGAGGLAGHFRFGARTGGALIIIGSILAALGILYGDTIMYIFNLLPLAILGVLLLFSGLELTLSIRDVDFNRKNDVFIMLFVTAISIGVSRYGFVIGLIGGILLAYTNWKKRLKLFDVS